MVPMECARLALCLLCVVSHQALGGKISFPGAEVTHTPAHTDIAEPTHEISESSDRGTYTFPDGKKQDVLQVSETGALTPESRGFWDTDFLQKLTGLFSGGEERTKPPARQGLRPEPLPPQLFNKNRRQGIHINRQVPSRKPAITKPQNIPYFQSPFQRPTHDQSIPKDAVASPTNNNLIHLPPPPPPPPSTAVTVPRVQPVTNFPYKYVTPSGASLQSPSNYLQPPSIAAPPRIDIPPKNFNIKPTPGKLIKTKKPLTFGQPDLLGAFSNNPRPQVSLPAKPVHQQVQRLQNRLPLHKSSSKPKPTDIIQLPHPRPAPKPQKQHPRPPPQPQRIDVHAAKPTAIQKKPTHLNFNPSPQEGSMLADAFQPVFVASPNMDDLGNDIMKPMHIASARSLPTTTTKPPPVMRDFFEDF
ncbi:uncharacterized protein LOC135224800 [Macrobrachium nipponense]|uniref:uncharacterized protein LOC135224800 n=1 Tax=Macrobrachium nipponense TaxID=159736 RepID=UPI0030C82571